MSNVFDIFDLSVFDDMPNADIKQFDPLVQQNECTDNKVTIADLKIQLKQQHELNKILTQHNQKLLNNVILLSKQFITQIEKNNEYKKYPANWQNRKR